LETGLGRAANMTVAALPGCTMTGDVSASDRFYVQDITAPLVLQDGHIEVPQGPGLGAEVIPDILDSFTISSEWIPA
jgi:o-succinylbenzoate synthase